jgi:hypothetical protein
VDNSALRFELPTGFTRLNHNKIIKIFFDKFYGFFVVSLVETPGRNLTFFVLAVLDEIVSPGCVVGGCYGVNLTTEVILGSCVVF